MFGDSLLEVSTAQRVRKSWITALSISGQAMLVLCLLALPLLKPERILLARSVPAVSFIADPQPMRTELVPAGAARPGTISIAVPHGFTFHPSNGGEETTEPTAACVVCPTGGPLTGSPGLPFPISGSGPVMPVPMQPHAGHPPRVSHFMGGSLIYKVQPVYPPVAKTAGIQGTVVLRAIISREGTVENLQLISGHPLLSKAAIEAVRQWRYRPYVLNGEPLEVETEVTVNFSLNRGE